ncbi:hypothetical protein D3C85_1247130 [compost metagenome]
MQTYQILVVDLTVFLFQRFAVLFKIYGKDNLSINTMHRRITNCNGHSAEKILFRVTADPLHNIPLYAVTNLMTMQEALQVFEGTGEILILLREL